MNEKPTYELDKILSSVEPEHFNRYRNEEDTDSQMSVSEFFNRYIGSYGLQLSDVYDKVIFQLIMHTEYLMAIVPIQAVTE